MKRRWVIVTAIALFGVICAIFLNPSSSSERKAVEETRRALRQQGFKTDLDEFNFHTSPELRTRVSALTNFALRAGGFDESGARLTSLPQMREFMIPIGTNSALVIWKEDKLESDPRYSAPDHEDTWRVLRQRFNTHGTALDAACDAALNGPIRIDLDATHGFSMLLPHLAALRNLATQLGMRALLELHEKNNDVAWTNLMALTGLVTAYEPEPVEVSHLVRCACTTPAYNATWQVLQAGGWSEERLAGLQHEWESVNFFQGWPQTAAFSRACATDLCRREREQPFTSSLPLRQMLRTPRYAWPAFTSYWQQARYRHHGSYQDEKALFLYYRDRELQLREAVRASNWSDMRELPGVTNVAPFRSSYSSRLQSQLNMRRISMSFQGQAQGPLGRTAEAEARRRIIIAALELERFRLRHNAYPNSLKELVPEFAKDVPIDFMDGKPLRYHPTDDGHFVLYSVGLDCADDGGIMPQRESRGGYDYVSSIGNRQSADLVWPRPATTAEIQTLKAEEEKVRQEQAQRFELQRAEAEIQEESARRDRVQKLLTFKQPRRPEPNIGESPISVKLQQGQPGPKLTLDQLLTLTQIITGEEPTMASFEAPLNYDCATNIGELVLLVDGGVEGLASGSAGEMQELVRAANGHCLLKWNTTFDPPGQHAVQAQFTFLERNKNTREIELKGPVMPFVSSNICQFDAALSQYDSRGATLYAKLPESNGLYVIELKSPDGELVKTMKGGTSNGIINMHWDLIDDRGRRYTNESLDSVFHVTLPDSGRSQTMKGP